MVTMTMAMAMTMPCMRMACVTVASMAVPCVWRVRRAWTAM